VLSASNQPLPSITSTVVGARTDTAPVMNPYGASTSR